MIRPIILVSLFFLIGCSPPVVDQKKEAENLMNLSREWAQAAMDRDLDKVISFWSDDAILMPPDEATIRGKQKIRMMINYALKNDGFELFWEPQDAYVSKSGDLGYVLVKSYLAIPDSAGNAQRVYHTGVELWRKQDDGSWKNIIDIYNRDPSLTSIK